jgi:sterol desaturase/sphingolipid hydroxylase (fatty acid hydroxylase superfamily)
MQSPTDVKHPYPVTPIDLGLFLRYFKKLAWDAFVPSLLLFLISTDGWNKLLSSWPYSDRLFFVAGNCIIHWILFYGMNTMTFMWDKYGIFASYKLPRTPPQIASPDLIDMTIKESIPAMFLIQPVLTWFLYPCFQYFGTTTQGPLPSFMTTMWQIATCSFLNDILFYTVHRLFHHPLVYELFHKKHHSYKGTIGFAAEFSHPVEAIFANLIPTTIGAVLLGVHTSVWFAFFACRLIETFESHAGYEFGMFSFAGGTEYHDFHHTVNIGNFGVNEFMDAFFRTNGAFLKHKQQSKTK